MTQVINLDLVEMDDETYDRGQKVRLQMDQIINQIQGLEVAFPLTWVYVWDMIKYKYQEMAEDVEYTVINPEKSIDDVWNALWANPVFSLEYGIEQLDDDIRDWLMSNKFIVDLEDLNE
jgi:hypothetical protein